MSDDNVIPFGKLPEEKDDYDVTNIVWVCNCGCRSFYLEATGHFQCTHCLDYTHADETVVRYGWQKLMPQVTEPESRVPDKVSHILGSPEFARRSVMKAINELSTSNNLAFVYGVGTVDESRSHTWTSAVTKQDHADVIQRLTGQIEVARYHMEAADE